MRVVKQQTDCGAPLFMAEMPHVHSVALGILVRAGTRDEICPEESGLAHAFEHMVFRGNQRFHTSEQLTGYLEKLGGDVNASTDSEATFFHATVPSRFLEESIEYLYHLVSTPIFHSRYIATEMDNVVGEIKSRNDNPEDFVDDLSDEMVYGNHPLGKPILGTIQSVSGFSRESFLHWQEKFYHPNNFSFIAVGNLNSSKVLRTFNRLFRQASKKPRNRIVSIPVSAPSQKLKLVRRSVEQVHLSLATAVNGANDDSTKALLLFERMIDGGMSFPLFQEVREKYGLGYDVNAQLACGSDAGTFKFYLGIEPKKLPSTLKLIFRIIQNTADSKKLFQEAKELMINQISMGPESASGVLQKLAIDLRIKNRIVAPTDVIRNIQAITPDNVSAAVKKYLQPKNFVQVMVAPKSFRPK